MTSGNLWRFLAIWNHCASQGATAFFFTKCERDRLSYKSWAFSLTERANSIQPQPPPPSLPLLVLSLRYTHFSSSLIPTSAVKSWIIYSWCTQLGLDDCCLRVFWKSIFSVTPFEGMQNKILLFCFLINDNSCSFKTVWSVILKTRLKSIQSQIRLHA